MSVEELKRKIEELEKKLAEKDEIIAGLQREVPLGLRGKTKRLGLEVKMLQSDDTNEEWPAFRVRDTFIKFFEEKCGHVYWKSSPVVPHNDPTLLFTNAGMNQFKPLFLGQADPNTELSKLKRAANTQKCIRAGGKHNDLEDVGKDVYHHTFFEMLGNWSFGDYFKKEAIDYAWELLTEVYGIDKDRLYVTYFEGNESVPADLEARDLWLRYLPAERVLPFDAKDNFWEMGDTGPCGPCSEVHFDRIGGRDAASLVNMDDPNVVEIWNLVFIQFNRKPDGTLERLPACHVDTGMGFERLTSALQNKISNYDTDVFTPIFKAIESFADVPAYSGKVGEEDVGNVDMAYRVVADHIRTLTFAITDGAFPSNEGRGYVLRRILRRAVRYGQEILKMPKGSFSKLVAVVVRHMQSTFPEIGEKESLVYEVILDEEETFARTLKRGVERFEKEVAKLKEAGKKVVPGSLSFFLYEAMGFPYDLTELMAAEHGLVMDKEGFDTKLQQHVERSRNARKTGSGEDESLRKLEAKETAYLEETLKLVPTEHSAVYTWYEDVQGATIQAIFDGENFVDSVELSDESSNKPYGFVLDKSNFYYESGGQLADSGALVLESDPTLVVAVSDCQSSKGFIVHAGSLERREDEESKADATVIKVGDKVTCKVDYERRSDLAKNHTCTHLLNFALRKAVSSDVDQKGSLVTEEKLRFDFNSQKAVPLENLIEVEKIVRAKIRESLPVHTKVVPLADAKRINALRAVFGETYPDPVRVVTVGPSVDEVIADPLNEKWKEYSVELCGGTHLTKSSEARAFSIVSEGALAKGIRRVICLTGDAAFKAAADAEALRARVEETAGLSGKALQAEVKALQSDLPEAQISVSDKHELSIEVEKVARKFIQHQKEEIAKATENALKMIQEAVDAGAKYVVYAVPESGSFVPKLGGDLMKKTKKTPIAIFLVQADEDDNTVYFYASVPKNDVSTLSAQAWVETAGEPCGVKGGGSPAVFNGKGSGTASLQGCVELASGIAAEKFK